MRRTLYFLLVVIAVGLAACGGRRSEPSAPIPEDKAAKKLLQGIWINDDDGSVAFMAKGDTILYPDTTSQPKYFEIRNDSLVLRGAGTATYPIVRQTASLFIFRNDYGDVMKLVKSTDPNDKYAFSRRPAPSLNQNKTIKRDTVTMLEGERYHVYIQVNPTTYKVIKESLNDDGVEVDNVYYDNIVNVTQYQGARRLFSRDFRKQDFTRLVPQGFVEGAIMDDIRFESLDKKGFHYTVSLISPDTPVSFEVALTIGLDGRTDMRVD